jgi:uncharacterized membrane protein required for colicin V production
MTFSVWDALILVFLIFYFVRGWRRGLAATVLHIFGNLLSLFAALAGGDRWGALFTQRFAQPLLAEKLGGLGAAATPVYEGVGFFLAFLFTFVLASVGLHLLSRLFKLAQILPVVGKLNSLLGGLLGVVLGTVLLFLIFYFLRLYAPALFDSYGWFSPTVQANSCLLPHFVQGNPGDLLRFLYQQIHQSST